MKRARQLVLAFALAVALGAVPLPAHMSALGASGISIPPQIDHNAKTITFRVKLFVYPACRYFYCQITDAMVAKIVTNIEGTWNNGLKFECYTIIFNFQIRKGEQWERAPDEVGIKINTSVDPIRSEVQTENRSRWDGSDPSDRLTPSGDGSTWGSPPMNDNTYAHEFGHVMGLEDGYHDVNGTPEDWPGAPHDLMSTGMITSNAISQETVNRLINRAGITKDDVHCDTGWRIHIEWTDSYDGVFDTVTFDGIIDTVPPDQPPGEQIYMTGIGTATGSRRGWKLCNPGIDVTPNGTTSATFQGFVSPDTLSFAAFADLGTVLAGVSTGLFVVPIDGGSFDVPQGVPVGDPCSHYSFGTGTATPFTPDTPP